MKKVRWLPLLLLIAMCLGGCGSKAVEGECECLVELTGLPKEMDKLDDNIREQLYVSVNLENIYTEKRVSVDLVAKEDFKAELKLKPGTYRVHYCYASDSNLLPWKVKEKQDTIELMKDKEEVLKIEVTNPEEVTDWIWNLQAGREVLQEDAFSHRVQFEGQLIDVEEILNYVEFEYEGEIRPYEKKTISGDKGVTVMVVNEEASPKPWQECTLKKVSFGQSNVIWGQGAYIGMPVKEAVHAEEGLYGMPANMNGTILAGLDYGPTNINWLDGKSGDKLTLTIHRTGDYISGISYEFEVYE